MGKNYTGILDRFVPAGVTQPLDVQRHRAAVFQSWLGVFFTVTFGALYALLGSPVSGAAILLIAVGLLFTPAAIRRGVSATQLGNLMIGLTWVATCIVTCRTGGFASPALVWNFLLPPCTYSVCGRRSALVWSVLGALQIVAFFAVDAIGVELPTDFSPAVLSVLRVSGYLGVILALGVVLVVVDSVRQAAMKAQEAANQLIERERLVSDIHDGVGGQLGVLIALAGSGRLAQGELVKDLEACLDDLRLIVDSLEQEPRAIEFALGELRARMAPRCEALGIKLSWEVEVAESLALPPALALYILRSAQEMIANALRHAQPKLVELRFVASSVAANWLRLTVRDDGVGVNSEGIAGRGRGLNNLRMRAQRLGGHFALQSQPKGALAVLEFPRPGA